MLKVIFDTKTNTCNLKNFGMNNAKCIILFSNVNTYQALELMAEILADQTHLLKSTEIIQDGVSK